jgi:regulatory protein
MIITALEELEQKKVKVFIDGEYAFLLYQKDIGRYKLCVGEEIGSALYDEIMEDTVSRRAKQKTLSLLKFMDRTEKELCRKLSEAGYTQEVIDEAIAYVSSYGYLNDERLASSYVRSRMNSKSKMVIKAELLQKGVDGDIIEKVFLEEYGEEEETDGELNAIRKAIARKTKAPDSLSYEEKQKLIASLYRKGFEIGKIKKILG